MGEVLLVWDGNGRFWNTNSQDGIPQWVSDPKQSVHFDAYTREEAEAVAADVGGFVVSMAGVLADREAKEHHARTEIEAAAKDLDGPPQLWVVWSAGRGEVKYLGPFDKWVTGERCAVFFTSYDDARREAERNVGVVIPVVRYPGESKYLQTREVPTPNTGAAISAAAEQKQHRTGGAAFPRPTSDMPGQVGMHLRDYFAGQALVGLLAAYAGGEERFPADGKAAQWAYEYADAMIAHRSPK